MSSFPACACRYRHTNLTLSQNSVSEFHILIGLDVLLVERKRGGILFIYPRNHVRKKRSLEKQLRKKWNFAKKQTQLRTIHLSLRTLAQTTKNYIYAAASGQVLFHIFPLYRIKHPTSGCAKPLKIWYLRPYLEKSLRYHASKLFSLARRILLSKPLSPSTGLEREKLPDNERLGNV